MSIETISEARKAADAAIYTIGREVDALRQDLAPIRADLNRLECEQLQALGAIKAYWVDVFARDPNTVIDTLKAGRVKACIKTTQFDAEQARRDNESKQRMLAALELNVGSHEAFVSQQQERNRLRRILSRLEGDAVFEELFEQWELGTFTAEYPRPGLFIWILMCVSVIPYFIWKGRATRHAEKVTYAHNRARGELIDAGYHTLTSDSSLEDFFKEYRFILNMEKQLTTSIDEHVALCGRIKQRKEGVDRAESRYRRLLGEATSGPKQQLERFIDEAAASLITSTSVRTWPSEVRPHALRYLVLGKQLTDVKKFAIPLERRLGGLFTSRGNIEAMVGKWRTQAGAKKLAKDMTPVLSTNVQQQIRASSERRGQLSPLYRTYSERADQVREELLERLLDLGVTFVENGGVELARDVAVDALVAADQTMQTVQNSIEDAADVLGRGFDELLERSPLDEIFGGSREEGADAAGDHPEVKAFLQGAFDCRATDSFGDSGLDPLADVRGGDDGFSGSGFDGGDSGGGTSDWGSSDSGGSADSGGGTSDWGGGDSGGGDSGGSSGSDDDSD
jgi:hypothetical protein